MKRVHILLTAFLLLIFSQVVFSQNYTLDNGSTPKSDIAVSQIPEEKVAKVVQQMEQKGMSIDEVLSIARIKGASELQLTELRQRILDFQQKKGTETTKATTSKRKNTAGLFSKRDFTTNNPQKETPQIFGFNFFNTKNLNFASNINTPLSEDYLLGAGDDLQISVYGASQNDYTLQVQKNNAIHIPNIGPVYVGGRSLAEAKKTIKNRLATIYNGMRGRNPNTFVTISVGNTAGINVNIIGEATKPGTYTLPATATVFNALYLAGGPSENGSFRSIDVIRDGKVIANTDVYSFLINGDIRGNIQLRNNDVIRVNPYLERIIIVGSFKRTGIFEAKAGETLADAIRFAGGFTADAYKQQLGITRNNSRSLIFKTVKANEYESFSLASGDKIQAGKVVERFENRVSIAGAVYRPGNYEITSGMTLADLIKKADGITDDAFVERGIITRKSDDMQLQTLSFSVKDVLNGSENIILKREDNVLISSLFDLREKQTIKILGAVQAPNEYPYAKGMTVNDLIFMAGGFNEKASVSN
ncbi:MAG: SLBB domain-containing protein, partial [Flavobacteriaceae bacterium]|nr:SLBB domain-containing protein [Flavobacteriaceae bacterium]